MYLWNYDGMPWYVAIRILCVRWNGRHLRHSRLPIHRSTLWCNISGIDLVEYCACKPLAQLHPREQWRQRAQKWHPYLWIVFVCYLCCCCCCYAGIRCWIIVKRTLTMSALFSRIRFSLLWHSLKCCWRRYIWRETVLPTSVQPDFGFSYYYFFSSMDVLFRKCVLHTIWHAENLPPNMPWML